ncbi:DUF7504 family protein [Salinibaculum rarum]|uniref:DUF7504 family protein n=1 Tax=Salinibaculum rarum TaxID=3058903 RepID=UPI00265F6A6B|nr:hypothetical protein [Salinibaculum sp. KK48]
MAERAESGEPSAPDLDALDGASNILLLAPSLGSRGRNAGMELLARTPPEKTNVLSISYTESPTEFVDRWTERVGVDPSRGGIVAVGQSEARVDNSAWAVRTVENPSDLTGVGIELSELLSGMANASDEDEHIAVSFHSITSLLQYADVQRAFRFLHVVTGRVKTVGGVGHYHIDPEAHDKKTLATLKGLFNAVVEVDEDGNWDIQQ